MMFENNELKLKDFAGEGWTGPVGDLSLLGLEWSTSDSTCLRLLLLLARRDISGEDGCLRSGLEAPNPLLFVFPFFFLGLIFLEKRRE